MQYIHGWVRELLPKWRILFYTTKITQMLTSLSRSQRKKTHGHLVPTAVDSYNMHSKLPHKQHITPFTQHTTTKTLYYTTAHYMPLHRTTVTAADPGDREVGQPGP